MGFSSAVNGVSNRLSFFLFMTGLENDLKCVLKIVLMIDLKNVLKNSFLFLHFLYIFHILNDIFV